VTRFVDEGATVGCLDRDAAALERLPERFPSGRALTYVADITVSSDVSRCVDGFAEAAGGLDGLVNSAGIDLVRALCDMTDDDWRTVLSVNLDGPMYVCRAAFPHLRAAGGGSIVNISSALGLQPLSLRTAYASSKAALQMFSKALALEGADFGIRVNSICPGAVDTPLLRSSVEAATDPALALENIRSRYALRRIAAPEEIAAAALWLVSAESSYVTGTAIAVDGGRTLH
jgi:NAD(P)-dependent dehydrogenase (short-subunit alcohol dehydrogenase family)